MGNKPDFLRTPDTGNTVADANLKVTKSLIIPNGPGFSVDEVQNVSGHIYIKTGPLPADVALQLYVNGQVYQLNQIGPKGDKGDQGLQGIQGIQGVPGNNGAPGTKGDTGAQGIQGVPGAAGASGAKGDTGAQGIQGAAGASGAKGDTGAQGIQGTPGAENATLDSVCFKGLNGQGIAETSYAIAAQTFYKTSLRSAKKQIKDYAGSALKTINGLRIRTFKYKKSNEHQVGFIIDEIRDRGLINSAGTAINTDSLLAIAVKALQEQSAIINELTKRVEALENGKIVE